MISIIIATKNEEANIANCLESIKAQSLNSQSPVPNSHFPIEIIVVDNNSTDKTKEIARKYTDKIYNFGPERSAQRNFGVKQANGKYILYLDADMILSENVISECVRKFQDWEIGNSKRLPPRKPGAFLQGELVALYIPERIINLASGHLNNLRNQPFWIKVRDFERSFYDATVIDCVRFVREWMKISVLP